MEKKVVRLANLSRRPAVKKIDAETERLLSGFRQLSLIEKETLLTLLDAFLLCKSQTTEAYRKP